MVVFVSTCSFNFVIFEMIIRLEEPDAVFGVLAK